MPIMKMGLVISTNRCIEKFHIRFNDKRGFLPNLHEQVIYAAWGRCSQMAGLDELLQAPQRKLVVCEKDILLDKRQDNTVFLLMVEESRGSAGGRAAGSGSRRIDGIYGYACKDGVCSKVFETKEESNIQQFDIPYSAVAMDIRLSDGSPYVVQGVVDSELVARYLSISNLK